MPVSTESRSMAVSSSSSASAQEAFRNQNYLEAVEMYERTLREKGPNVDLYLGLADSLARAGKIREAMDVYSQAYRTGVVSSDRLKGLVNTLIESVTGGSTSTSSSGNVDGTIIENVASQTDISTCCICWGFLTEPVTLPCGHTFCRKCVANVEPATVCQRCNAKMKTVSSSSEPKVNVVIGNVLEKWWPNETQAVICRTEGNQLFQKRQVEEAVAKYQKARELAPSDHLAVSNQSHALLQLGRSEDALQCADQATRIRPSWSKAYYRKATALQSLGRYEDALIAYVQCLALDPDAASVKNELTKLLHKVMSSTISKRLSNELRSSPYPLPRVHGSQSAQDVCDSDDSDPGSSSQLKGMQGTRVCGKMKRERLRYASCNIPVPDKSLSEEKSSLLVNPQLRRLVDRCLVETDKIKKFTSLVQEWRTFDPNVIDKSDFECTLCFRLFWQPVTTPCGHMFCRMCLDRCLDHNPVCPLCKTSLDEYLAERRQAVTEFIKVLMEKHLSQEYNERQGIHEEEMTELARAGTDEQHEVSIFVCTTAYPTVPCPLHVFEPRYRLMIRQCMESGTRQFGMCTRVDDAEGGFAEYGTMLEIREVQYFPDGRAVVDCIGNRRFKVLHKGERDGYNTGSVQFLHDDAIDETALDELRTLHNTVRAEAVAWLGGLRDNVRQQILSHFGSMPDVEENWSSLSDGPSWCWWAIAVLPLDKQAQLHILAMTSLKKRLESIQWVIRYIQQTGIT